MQKPTAMYETYKTIAWKRDRSTQFSFTNANVLAQFTILIHVLQFQLALTPKNYHIEVFNCGSQKAVFQLSAGSGCCCVPINQRDMLGVLLILVKTNKENKRQALRQRQGSSDITNEDVDVCMTGWPEEKRRWICFSWHERERVRKIQDVLVM